MPFGAIPRLPQLSLFPCLRNILSVTPMPMFLFCTTERRSLTKNCVNVSCSSSKFVWKKSERFWQNYRNLVHREVVSDLFRLRTPTALLKRMPKGPLARKSGVPPQFWDSSAEKASQPACLICRCGSCFWRMRSKSLVDGIKQMNFFTLINQQ